VSTDDDDDVLDLLIVTICIVLLSLLAVAFAGSLRMNRLEDACTAAGGIPVRTNSTTLCVKEFLSYDKETGY
jgi:hypothetical protein